MRTLSIATISILIALGVSGCERLGSPLDVLGGKRPGPDEFQVVKRKPLQMPRSLSLPEPRLGERSPLDFDPANQAATVLTGNQQTATTGPSAGESALLSAANAEAAQSDIRTQLIEDKENPWGNQPYEAPTILELVNLDGEKAEDVLNADAEADRLRQQGVAPAPVNPAAVPNAEE
ncbi:MAG: DUF3035 domain-containing protein [Pseudomonadota bacterium]